MQSEQRKSKQINGPGKSSPESSYRLRSMQTAAIILSMFMMIESPVALAKELTFPVSDLLKWQTKSVQELIKLTGAESLSSKGKSLIEALTPFRQIFRSPSSKTPLIEGSLKFLTNLPAQPFHKFIKPDSWDQTPDSQQINPQVALNRTNDIWNQNHISNSGTPESHKTQPSESRSEHRDSPAPDRKQHADSESGSDKIVVRVQQDQDSSVSTKPIIRVEHTTLEQNLSENSKPDHSDESIEDQQFLNYLKQAEEDLNIAQHQSTGNEAAQNLTITRTGQKISIEPRALTLEAGAEIAITLKSFDPKNPPNIFVRNESLVTTVKHSGTTHLKAANSRQGGSTEIYLVHNNELAVLPVEILSARKITQKTLATRTAPAPLVPASPLSGLTVLNSQDSRAETDSTGMALTSPDKIQPFTPMTQNGRFLSDQDIEQFNAYEMTNRSIQYEKVAFLAIDERHGSEKPYPLPRVKITVPGTSFTALTNAQGRTLQIYVPKGSRFLVRTEDSSGFYQPGVHQISTSTDELIADQNGVKLITLPLMFKERLSSLFVMSKPAHSGQPSETDSLPFTANPASLCGVVTDEDGDPLEGISVQTNAYGARLTYMNGFADLPGSAQKTGPSGQFCLFNFEPGAMGLKFLDSKGDVIDTFPASLYSGHHIQASFSLYKRKQIFTNLASISSPREHVSKEMPNMNKLSKVYMANVIPLGGDLPQFRQVREGLLDSDFALPSYEGRYCYVTEPADFEMTYQCVNERDASGGKHITSMVPPGFMEVLSSGVLGGDNLELQHPDLGSVIIEHGDLIGQGTKGETGRVKIELVNFQGQKLSHGFHDGYGDLTKSIFFNVNSGIYNVLVKNSDGVLIASDTAIVFDGGAITYLKTGNQLVAKSPDLSQSEATPEESDKKG